MDYIKTAFKTFGFAAFGLFACAASAETNLFGGLTDADSTEIKASDGNLDVVLNPNESDPTAEAFFKGNGNTIGSLKTAGTPSSWTVSSGTTTIDINQAGEGSFDALTNNGSMSFSNSIFEIVNSAGTSAVANINVGDLTIKSVEDAEGTYGYACLYIKTNANLTGSYLTGAKSSSGGMSGVRISGNSNVVSTIANFSLGNGNYLKVEKGSTFTHKGSLSFNGTSDLNVAGTFTVDTNESVNLRLANITGNFTVNGADICLMGTANLSGDGILSTSKNLLVYSWATLNGNSKLVLGKDCAITFRGAGNQLTLNSENSVSCTDGDTESLADIYIFSDASSPRLVVNADNKFNNLIWGDDGRNIIITVAADAHLSFKGFSLGSGAGNATLTINKFVEGTIFVEDISGWEKIETIALTTIDGTEYTNKEDFHWIWGKYIDGTEGFWLSTTVPEPATCALIFGAMAMAFALRRRLGK